MLSGFEQPLHYSGSVIPELKRLEETIDKHSTLEQRLKTLMRSKGLLPRPRILGTVYIPVLVIACSRTEIKRTLDGLLRYRAVILGRLSPDSAFPITVSHGCDHKPTADLLATYGTSISILRFTDIQKNRNTNLTKFQLPYRSVSHHYKFAFEQMFRTSQHSSLIVVEDDLDIAPDFFEYFTATLPLLQSDRSLFCVSAWNDNGRPELINPKRNDLIYRTDFFSGLGWMMLRDFWLEIRNGWPDAFWDEYIRQDAVRKGRSCLRPEIGRTVTFGRRGVSRGQYFDQYMKTMVLNSVKYDFINADLNYLNETRYLSMWQQAVYSDSTEISVDDLFADRLPQPELVPSLRVIYTSVKEFVKIADFLNLMSDIKSGVMRTAFRGVVHVTWKHHTLYVAPPANSPGHSMS